MNIIMSLWTKPCLDNKKHGFNTIEQMIESLILSSNVVKRHYNDIHFYTDKIGYEWITPYLSQLPFTKIEVCLDEMNWLDDHFWSLVKLYVYKLQKEPFIHIDNDVFIWDKFPEKLFESDFFFQEIEFFHQAGRDFYLKGLELYKDALPKEIKVSDGAFNCGVFACVNQKALSLMERYYDYGIEFVKKTENIVNLHFEEVSKRWLASVIIEQVLIYSLVIFGDYKYDYILYNGFDKKHEMKYSHTIAHHKRHPVVVNMIRERVLLKNWY